MNMEELKGRLLEALPRWADSRIEELAKGNPSLAIASVYMKRAAHNLAACHGESLGRKLDGMALFIADENGNVNADTLLEDMLEMLRLLPRQEMSLGLVSGHIGEGTIDISLPDNILTTLLFGSKRTVSIGVDDLRELKEMMACPGTEAGLRE